jgi:hypothetical protein
MTSEAMRADLVNRIQNAVTDLRNEWVSAGAVSDAFTVEAMETPTGVSVSLVVLVGGESSDKKEERYTPLPKKRG